jgi:hypothetical protein
MINVLWVRRRRYIAGMYRDNLRDTVAWQGPMLCIIYHYHYHCSTISPSCCHRCHYIVRCGMFDGFGHLVSICLIFWAILSKITYHRCTCPGLTMAVNAQRMPCVSKLNISPVPGHPRLIFVVALLFSINACEGSPSFS